MIARDPAAHPLDVRAILKRRDAWMRERGGWRRQRNRAANIAVAVLNHVLLHLAAERQAAR